MSNRSLDDVFLSLSLAKTEVVVDSGWRDVIN